MSNHINPQNPRNAGRKPIGPLTRQVTLRGLTQEQADALDNAGNKAEYIRNLIQRDIEKSQND